MEIVNHADKAVSWFCFNSNDLVKMVALGSGDLKATDDSFSYSPPDNGTHLYFVRFTDKGGGTELAGAIVKQKLQSIALIGTDGAYQAKVTDL